MIELIGNGATLLILATVAGVGFCAGCVVTINKYEHNNTNESETE